MNIIPDDLLTPGMTYELDVEAKLRGSNGSGRPAHARFAILAAGDPEAKNPLMSGDVPVFEATHMQFTQPDIVTSLDQIGIMCQTLPFCVVDSDEKSGRFLAWGIQRFGEFEGDERLSVADSRCLFYAFSGRANGDCFAMEALDCLFDCTAFPVPMDRFRFSGRMTAGGEVMKGASLLAEWKPRGLLKSAELFAFSEEQAKKGARNWLLNAIQKGSPLEVLEAARVTVPTAMNFMLRKIWGPWGFLNGEGRFVSAGTFKLRPLPNDPGASSRLKVERFEFDRKKRKIIAEGRRDRACRRFSKNRPRNSARGKRNGPASENELQQCHSPPKERGWPQKGRAVAAAKNRSQRQDGVPDG